MHKMLLGLRPQRMLAWIRGERVPRRRNDKGEGLRRKCARGTKWGCCHGTDWEGKLGGHEDRGGALAVTLSHTGSHGPGRKKRGIFINPHFCFFTRP